MRPNAVPGQAQAFTRRGKSRRDLSFCARSRGISKKRAVVRPERCSQVDKRWLRMALANRLMMRQGQTMVLTPQLLQAIKLLQMPNAELAAFIEAELERNPLLERADELPVFDAAGARRGDGGRSRGVDPEPGDWASETLESDPAGAGAAVSAPRSTTPSNSTDRRHRHARRPPTRAKACRPPRGAGPAAAASTRRRPTSRLLSRPRSAFPSI